MSKYNPRQQSASVPSGFHAPVSSVSSPPTPRAGFPLTPHGPFAPAGLVQQDRQQHAYNHYGGIMHPPVTQSFHNYQSLGPSHQTHHLTLPLPHQNPTAPFNESNLEHVTRKRPMADQYHCNPCGLSFDSLSALSSHEASHIQCVECSFRASPKAVKAHHQASHGKFSGTGFKMVTINVPGCPVQRFRICIGNRPEDIQQWIAERRKRFPRVHPTNGNNTSKTVPTSKLSSPVPTAADSPAVGLSSLLDGYGSSSSSSDGDDENEQQSLRPEAPQPAVDSHPVEKPLHASVPMKRPCHFFARHGRCRNGDQCRYSHDVTHCQPAVANPRDGCVPYARTKPALSLLDKLLADEMRRERLLTIQLLEHIVDTDFLTKPQLAAPNR